MIFDRFLVIEEPEHSCPLVSLAHALKARGYEVDLESLQKDIDSTNLPEFARWRATPHHLRRMMERAGIRNWKAYSKAQYLDRYWMETSPPANLRFSETFMRFYQTAIELLPDAKETHICVAGVEKFSFGTFRRVRFPVLEGETARAKVAWELCINNQGTGILFKEAYD